MCNIDRLKLLQAPLSIDGDFSLVWKRINKVIDSLHIKNHTHSLCHIQNNPEKVKEVYPDANLMTCEQTHFHILLHCLVNGRNRYTEYCYKKNRYPLLPSVKVPKILLN